MRYNQRDYLNKNQYITAKIICQLSHIRNIEDIKFRIYFLYLCCLEVMLLISYEPLFKTMKKKGITSYRLGKMGFPLSNYYAMKRGDNISTHTLNQLCKLLSCRVEEVMEYIDEE